MLKRNFIDMIPKEFFIEMEKGDKKWRDFMVEETLNHLNYKIVKKLKNGEVIIEPVCQLQSKSR